MWPGEIHLQTDLFDFSAWKQLEKLVCFFPGRARIMLEYWMEAFNFDLINWRNFDKQLSVLFMNLFGMLLEHVWTLFTIFWQLELNWTD